MIYYNDLKFFNHLFVFIINMICDLIYYNLYFKNLRANKMVTIFFDLNSSAATANKLGTFFMSYLAHPQGDEYVDTLLPAGHYLGYLGVLAAFILPNMGALSAGNYALSTIQDGFTDFVINYLTITGRTD